MDDTLELQSGINSIKKYFIGKGQVKCFHFRQMSKTNSAYLYLVNTGDRIYYEVFRKRINHRYGCISYPTIKAFGIWAWTTPDLARAFEILNDLSREEPINKSLYNYSNKSIKN